MADCIDYPRDLAEGLLSAIGELHHGFGDSPTLSRDQLATLLDIAWSATMIEEEGRRSNFTLGVAPAEAASAGAKVQTFAQPRPLTPATIAKLAPAADSAATLIGVVLSGKNEFEIWGLIHLGDRSFSNDLEIAQIFLKVTGFRPGGFFIESHGNRLVLCMNGVATWYEREAEGITDLLRDTLHPTALKVLFGAGGGALAHEFERLAGRLVLAGHGGAFLVSDRPLPTGVQIPPGSVFAPPNASLLEAVKLHTRYTSGGVTAEEKANGARILADAERAHRDALEHVSRLANVDGAVVMAPDLRVFGFGATIQMRPNTRMPEVRAFDPREPPNAAKKGRLSGIQDFPGHRHKSALHYCAMQSGRKGALALAIVASQDGTLPLFGLTTKGTIAIYRPFLLRSVR